jgi:hypothetical protein
VPAGTTVRSDGHYLFVAVTAIGHTGYGSRPMSLGERVMWRRKKTGVIAIAAGVVLLVAGLADHAFAAPKAALCQSGIGQFVQDLDGTVAHDCGLVTALEAATGWLLVFGVLVAVFGAAVLWNARASVPQPATPPDPWASARLPEGGSGGGYPPLG